MVRRYTPEGEPDFNAVGGSDNSKSPVYGDVRASLDLYEDAFGRPVQLNINNVADIAAHYPYSPERLRVFVDGTRQFIQYDGEPAQYEDTADSHKLKPQSNGEVVTLETTEIYRYAVQYVIEWSAAHQTNQALQTGDVVTLGYGDADLENSPDDSPGPSADGWFWIWDSSIGTNEVTVAQYRDGTEQDSQTVPTSQALTDWTRRSSETNWYGVGRTTYVETYTRRESSTSERQQLNDLIGTTAKDDGKGPLLANHPVQVSVKTGASGAGSLEVEVGSIGVRYLGDIDPVFRRKTAQERTSGTTVDSTDTYVPLLALRVDPDRRIVNTQLVDIDVAEFSGAGDIQVLAVSADESNVLDSDGNTLGAANYSTPVEHTATGSVIERSTDVAQFPNSTGSTVTSATDPGGYQEGYGSLFTAGTGSKAPTTQAGQQAKRPISERDVVVFLAKATATGDVNFEYTTEQQW